MYVYLIPNMGHNVTVCCGSSFFITTHIIESYAVNSTYISIQNQLNRLKIIIWDFHLNLLYICKFLYSQLIIIFIYFKLDPIGYSPPLPIKKGDIFSCVSKC